MYDFFFLRFLVFEYSIYGVLSGVIYLGFGLIFGIDYYECVCMCELLWVFV